MPAARSVERPRTVNPPCAGGNGRTLRLFGERMGHVLTAILLIGGASIVDHVLAARKARQAGDAKTWLAEGQQALAHVPDHPDLLISMARAQAANGHATDAVGLLRQAIERGAGLEVQRVQEFQALPASVELDDLSVRARRNLAAVPRAEVFAVLPDATAQPEGVEYDPATRRVFTGTTHGEILQIDPAGTVSTFVPRGGALREVLGIKVDARRRLLWAATCVYPELFSATQGKPDAGISGVIAYSLETGKLVQQAWLDERPSLHGFNDLAVARGGDVYVTDTPQNAVYRLHGGKLSLLFRHPRMSLPNGIVLAPDQRHLYVAALEGLIRFDLRTGMGQPVAVPRDAAVNSIDGLSWHEGALVGVQRSPYLARIVRIELSKDGASVVRTVTLNARSPAEYNQTTVAVGKEWLYAVASAPAIDTSETPLASAPKPQILRIPLEVATKR